MSRYIEQEYIGKTVSNLPTEVFQTENRIELVLSATEVIDAIKDAPSIDIVCCGECKKLRDCRHDSWQKGVINMGYVGWCEKTSRLGDVTYVKANDFCSYGERDSEKPNKSEIPTDSERSSE